MLYDWLYVVYNSYYSFLNIVSAKFFEHDLHMLDLG